MLDRLLLPLVERPVARAPRVRRPVEVKAEKNLKLRTE